jgi:hypothetical protein
MLDGLSFDGLHFDERLFWLIPLAFYLADNAKTVAEDELIVLEDLRFRWRFKLDKTPFLVRGRHLYILPLLAPHLIAVKFPWFRHGVRAQRAVLDARRRISRWRGRSGGLRTISICSFVLMFVIAPVLTFLVGLFNTLLLVLPPHLILLTLASLWLAIRRRTFGLGRWQAAVAVMEIVLVPGYLPNLCRRTAWATLGGDVDGVAFVKRCAPPETAAALIDAVRFRLSEEWLGADDAEASAAAIAAYRRELDI